MLKGCLERRKGGPFASETLKVWEPVKILVLEDHDSTRGGALTRTVSLNMLNECETWFCHL